MFKAFSKIWILVAAVAVVAAGIFVWQYRPMVIAKLFYSENTINFYEAMKLPRTAENFERIMALCDKIAPSSNKRNTCFQLVAEDYFKDWKVYKNEQYGFEFKYPKEINFSSIGPNSAQQAINRGEQISGTVQPSYDKIVFKDGGDELAAIEIFHKYEKGVIPKNYKDEDYLYLYGPCDIRSGFLPASIDSKSINSINVLAVKGNTYSCYYLKNSSGNLIVFSNSGYEADTSEQILSTFRFPEKNTQLESIGPFIEDKLAKWVNAWKEIIPGFDVSLLQKIKEGPIVGTEYSYSPDKLREFLYVYSPDKKKFLDPYVYMHLVKRNGKITSLFEPDSGVALVNLENKKSKQVLFCGTPCGFDEAAWVDNNIFVVAGNSEYYPESGEVRCAVNTKCTYVATFWILDLAKNKTTLFYGPESIKRPILYLQAKFPQIDFNN